MTEFNFATNFEAIADELGGRPLITFRNRHFTYDQFRLRARRLANALIARGLGSVIPRSTLEGWQSGQDHVGLYLYNGNEYLEGMMGAYMSRTAPFNINYRYVADELAYLFQDAAPRALIYHARFAAVLREVRHALPAECVLLQVSDQSGEPLLAGAEDYEQVLASASDERPAVEPSPDDLYIVYTGGTTGMPKGVLWRQHDIFMGAMGGTYGAGKRHASVQAILEGARRLGPKLRAMPLPPFMHAAAHWMAFVTMHNGGCLVLQDTPERLDPAEIWSLVEREGVTSMLLVGDAFALPLLEELDRRDYDVSSLKILGNGGAVLSAHLKQRIRRRFPGIYLRDALGSSESGAQAVVASGHDAFAPGPDTGVASEDLSRLLRQDEQASGWLVRSGHIPLGYLNDPDKTRRAFVRIDGKRFAVPGDHARWTPEGHLSLLGRGSVCINTGGEKVYPEEVEEALKAHPDVYDALVVGVPDPKWGQQVAAVVQLRESATPSVEELQSFAAQRLSRFKLPRKVVWVTCVERSPSGKADYRWARRTAEGADG